MERDIVWYARAEGVARMGPYASQVDASEAVLGLDGLPVAGAYVWPERPRRALGDRERWQLEDLFDGKRQGTQRAKR